MPNLKTKKVCLVYFIMRKYFTPEEDTKLLELVMEVGTDFPFIASQIGVTLRKTQTRYYNLRHRIEKKFHRDEIQKMVNLVKKFGKEWDFIASEMKKPSLECKFMYDYMSRPQKYHLLTYFTESEDKIIRDKLKQGLKPSQISLFLKDKGVNQIHRRIRYLKKIHKL